MLNYIWAGLVIASLGFALCVDVGEMWRDPYRNGRAINATLRFAPGADPAAAKNDVAVEIDAEDYRAHYDVTAASVPPLRATLLRSEVGDQLRFAKDAPLPAPLSSMRELQNPERELRAQVRNLGLSDGAATASVVFDPVRWTKIKAIQDGAIESAKTAVTLAISLVGVLALWLGLMKIAEASGLIAVFVALVQPVLRPLFPQVPPGHPALGMIALNLAANMLGLGNAATPMGLKAMEELQKLNPTDDTATDPMVMLLAMNTAGVQLLPPATLVALMGIAAGKVYIPILIVTAISLGIAILAAKLLGRLPGYRSSNPNLYAPPARPATIEGEVAR